MRMNLGCVINRYQPVEIHLNLLDQLPIGRAAAAYKNRGNRVLVHDWFSATSLAQRCKEMNTTFWRSVSVVVTKAASCFCHLLADDA